MFTFIIVLFTFLLPEVALTILLFHLGWNGLAVFSLMCIIFRLIVAFSD